MILCLDVGNSQIFGGVFGGEELCLRFRYDTRQGITSDQLGVFLRNVLFHNGIDGDAVKKVSICSVVPSMDYSLHSAVNKYFDIEPFFLQAGVKTGLNIQTHNPAELGADMIATAIGAVHHHPKTNLIVVDFGTATKLYAVTQDKRFLGVSILAGMQISSEVLQSKTAKLPMVDIAKPESVVGRNTRQSIQSGLYYSHIGAIKEITKKMAEEQFSDTPPMIICTGGLGCLFEKEKIFHAIMPNLVLDGLCFALLANKMN